MFDQDRSFRWYHSCWWRQGRRNSMRQLLKLCVKRHHLAWIRWSHFISVLTTPVLDFTHGEAVNTGVPRIWPISNRLVVWVDLLLLSLPLLFPCRWETCGGLSGVAKDRSFVEYLLADEFGILHWLRHFCQNASILAAFKTAVWFCIGWRVAVVIHSERVVV